jgi:hypothetical protein
MMDMMSRISGVNENMLGMINPGGRKTATEIRSSNTLSAGRLKTTAEYNSAIGWSPLSQMLLQETQQRYDMSRKYRIAGQGVAQSATFADVSPESIQGFYDLVAVDGAMPIDRFAMANLIRELSKDAIAMPNVPQQLDFMKMIEEVANLSGIRYFNKFRIQAMPPGVLNPQVAAGNVIPLGGPGGGNRRGAPGLEGVSGPSQVPGVGPTQ